jgi:hypothetical protein
VKPDSQGKSWLREANFKGAVYWVAVSDYLKGGDLLSGK